MTKAQYRKAREELLVMLVCTALVALLMLYVIPVLIRVPAAALKDDSFTPRTFPYFLGTIRAICVLIGDVKTGVEFVRARREALASCCAAASGSITSMSICLQAASGWFSAMCCTCSCHKEAETCLDKSFHRR